MVDYQKLQVQLCMTGGVTSYWYYAASREQSFLGQVAVTRSSFPETVLRVTCDYLMSFPHA